MGGWLKNSLPYRDRVKDAEQHLTQLQTDIHALQQQHHSQVAQMGKETDRLLANIQDFENKSAQLEDKLNMLRYACMHMKQDKVRRLTHLAQ